MTLLPLQGGGIFLTTTSQVREKLRCRGNAGNQKAIARAGAGDVKKMALRVVHLFKVGFVRNSLDPRLERQHVIVAGHDRHTAELKALGKARLELPGLRLIFF
jgi:hypothetical protein